MKTKTIFIERSFNKLGTEVTKEEFIQWMMEDIEATRKPYRELSDKEADERYAKACEEFEVRTSKEIARIIAEVQKKYKRLSTQTAHIEREVAKLPKELKRTSYYIGDDLSSITWDIEPWRNGSPYFSTESKYLENQIAHTYDDAIKNKYFQQCTGWSIVTEGYSPEFKLHLSDVLQAEWNAEQKKLADEISEFYATCRYCGD